MVVSKRGRASAATGATSRARSLKVSLSAKEAGEGRSVTIELDNPDEMIDKVVNVLSARYPVNAFFDAVSSQDDGEVSHSFNSTIAPMITSLEQAIQRADEVSKILPEELRLAWLEYVAARSIAPSYNSSIEDVVASPAHHLHHSSSHRDSVSLRGNTELHKAQESSSHTVIPAPIAYTHPLVIQASHEQTKQFVVPPHVLHNAPVTVHPTAPVLLHQTPLLVQHHHQAPMVVQHQQAPVVVQHHQAPVVVQHHQQAPVVVQHHHQAPVLVEHHQHAPVLVQHNQQAHVVESIVPDVEETQPVEVQNPHVFIQSVVPSVVQNETSIRDVRVNQEAAGSESAVFDDEGKWEVWNPDLADIDTEHSGISSAMDESSFHDSQVAAPIVSRHVPTEATVVGGHTQMAESLAARGFLAELIALPDDVTLSHPALIRIAQQANFDAESLRMMVSLFRTRPDFHSWCSNLISAHVQTAKIQKDELAGVAASAILAGNAAPAQPATHQLVGPAGLTYQVQRQVASPEQQSLEVSNAAMTVQTTVTVNPTLMDGHVAHTTTTLMKKQGTKETIDNRPIGTVSISSPVATPSAAFDYTVGASPITAKTVASPSLLKPSMVTITPKADMTPMADAASDEIMPTTGVIGHHHAMMHATAAAHSAVVIEADRVSVFSSSPVAGSPSQRILAESPLARYARNSESHVLIEHDKLMPEPMTAIIHQVSPMGTSTRSSHSGSGPAVRSVETRVALDVDRVRDRLNEIVGVSAFRYPLPTHRLDTAALQRYLENPEYAEVFESVVHYTFRAAQNLFGELFDSFSLPTPSALLRARQSSLPRLPLSDDISTIIDVLKGVTIINVVGSLMKYVRDHMTPELQHTFSAFVSHLNSIISETTARINLETTGVVSQFVQMWIASSHRTSEVDLHTTDVPRILQVERHVEVHDVDTHHVATASLIVPRVEIVASGVESVVVETPVVAVTPQNVADVLLMRHDHLGPVFASPSLATITPTKITKALNEEHEDERSKPGVIHSMEVPLKDLLAAHVPRRSGAEEDKHVTTIETNAVRVSVQESSIQTVAKDLTVEARKVSVSSRSADASAATHHTVEIHDVGARNLGADRVAALTAPPPGVQVIRTIVHPVGYRPSEVLAQPSSQITATTTTYSAPQPTREIIYLQQQPTTDVQPLHATALVQPTTVVQPLHATALVHPTTVVQPLHSTALVQPGIHQAAVQPIIHQQPVIHQQPLIHHSSVQPVIHQSTVLPAMVTGPTTLVSSPLASQGRIMITPLTVLPRSDLGSTTQLAQAMTTPASFVRSQSPLARNIGHERLFDGRHTTTVIQTTSKSNGISSEVTKPSSYVDYADWKARAGVDVDVTRGTEVMKSTMQIGELESSIKVGDLQVTMPGSITPVANVMIPNTVASPLIQLHKENPNAILSHLAQHWTSQSVEKDGSVSTHTKQ